MTIEIKTFTAGPIQNNCYLLLDKQNNIAVLIDPPIGVEIIFPSLLQNGINVSHILITHAHFDHIGGIQAVLQQFAPQPGVYMHRDELSLWQQKGNAANFGIDFSLAKEPDHLFEGEPILHFGEIALQVLFTPGHTGGHCTFYNAESKCAFCGDVIFHHGIGRTDLPGGDFNTLAKSIRTKIYTLPAETILYPGHGVHTSVKEEMSENPFVQA